MSPVIFDDPDKPFDSLTTLFDGGEVLPFPQEQLDFLARFFFARHLVQSGGMMKIWEGGQQIEVPGTTLYDQASATVLYIGEAKIGTPTSASAWSVRKIIFSASGDPVSTTWANKGAHTAIWDNRASLGYE